MEPPSCGDLFAEGGGAGTAKRAARNSKVSKGSEQEG